MRSRRSLQPGRQVTAAAEKAANDLLVTLAAAGFGPLFVGVIRVPGRVVVGLYPTPENHNERFKALETYLRKLGLDPLRTTKYIAGIEVEVLGVELGFSLPS